MRDIYAYHMEFEQCDKIKEHINVIVPYAVIHYVISGIGYVNGQKVTEGFCFFADKNSHIEYYPDGEQPWSYIYVRLAGEETKEGFTYANFSELFSFDKTKDVFHLLSLHKTLKAENDREAQKMIANLLLMLHSEESSKNSHDSAAKKNADKIKTYIENHYFKKITIEKISEELYLSPNYIRTLCAQYLRFSPKQYIQTLRMNRAKELLKNTDMSITLIAHSVGYEDALLFSKMFSRYFNLSPKQFRKTTVKTRIP